MNISGLPLTAIERARIAYYLMAQRRRAVALQQRQRERSRLVTIATAMIGLVMLLVGTGLYNGWIPTSMRTSILTRVDDDGKFGETRTGHVRSFVKGDTCQELQFNNVRGLYVGGALVPCESFVKREMLPLTKSDRVNSIRDAFTSR